MRDNKHQMATFAEAVLRFTLARLRIFVLVAVLAGLAASTMAPLAHGATTSEVVDIQLHSEAGKLGLNIVTTGPVEYKLINQMDPRRSLIVELSPATLASVLPKSIVPRRTGAVEKVRAGQFSTDPNVVRVVMDLKSPIQYKVLQSSNRRTITLFVTPPPVLASGIHHFEALREKEKEKSGTSLSNPPGPVTTREAVSKTDRSTAGKGKSKSRADGQSTGKTVTREPAPSPEPVVSQELLAQKTPPSGPITTKEAIDKGKEKPATPKKTQPAPPPRVEKPKPRPRPRARRVYVPTVSLDLKNADLLDVLKAIARETNINIIATQSVKGSVSVRLVDVPIDDALNLILGAHGFLSRRIGNVTVVGTKEELDKISAIPQGPRGPVSTQVIRLENAPPADVAKSLQLAFPEATIQTDERINALIVKAPAATIKQIKNFVPNVDVPTPPPPIPPPVQTEVVYLKHTNTDEVMTQMGGLVPQGAVKADKRLNALIVTTQDPTLVENIKKFVETVDIASPQVMLDLKVMELSDTAKKTLGVQWPGASAPMAFGEPGTAAVPPVNPIQIQAFARDPLLLSGVTVNLLMQTGDVKILAQPKVATLNNKKATIHIGTSYPLVYYDPRAGLYQAQYTDVGVKMDVTPTINPDGTMIIVVSAEVSELGQFVQNFPEKKIRRADTSLLVKDGETVVLGGLTRERNEKNKNKVPLLGDIPVIGELFTNRSVSRENTDLVVMITPHVLSNVK
ncbi:MAG: AMIN domain-containing protein [Armatimonadetes bacterium]|nr:AMIN domain-containing protein [Armatimonadota bacterium]